jgi:hypothetical protein
MRILFWCTTTSRLIGAAAALWLGAGSAWAGSGGSGDTGSYYTSLCGKLGLSAPPAPCPSVATLTQTILEIAALEAAPPEIVRAANSIAPTVAINAVNPPAGVPFDLSKVTPLAFVSGKGGTLAVTNPGDDSANSFFYAGTDGVLPSTPLSFFGTPPTTLYLVYDFPPLTNPTPAIAKGLDLADICLPLTSLSGYGTTNTETPLPTLLRILNASPSGNAMVVVGSCSPTGKSVPASSIGLTVTLTFQSSPNSATKHAVISVQVPLLLTATTDPTYFGLPTSSPPDLAAWPRQGIFLGAELGSPYLNGTYVGMSPVAAEFTASIASNIDGGQNSQGQSTVVSVKAVDAALAIAIDGEVLVSQLLPQP